jgi:hypothetical protein
VLALQQNCPRCGRANDASRRFCAKCGHQLIPSPGRPLGRTVEKSLWRGWWERLWDTRDRSARRAYRRSLPPLLRWRRVLAGLMALALVVGGTVLVRRTTGDSPVASVVDRWYDVRNRDRYVFVQGVQASLAPAAPGQKPARLVDSSRDAWTTPWSGEEGRDCRPPPGVSVIVLTFPEARIQRMDFRSGLSEKLSDRLQQFRPRTLGISFDEDACSHHLDLDNKYDNLNLHLDSGKPVTSIHITVETAYPPEADKKDDLLSVGEISLQKHPRRVF